MPDELVQIYLCETDTVTLLDVPNAFVSEDADDADATRETADRHAETSKSGIPKKCAWNSTQTSSEAPKNGAIQSDRIDVVDEAAVDVHLSEGRWVYAAQPQDGPNGGTLATPWDIHDSFCDQKETLARREADRSESPAKTSEQQTESSSNTPDTASLTEMETSEPQLFMKSESFTRNVIIMERSIILNNLRPTAGDPGRTPEESSSSPTLEGLWAFSSKLTRTSSVTSAALNRQDPDILAVGYGDFNRPPFLICCWSLKNQMRPRTVFHCHSCVTSLDFCANVPGLLAAGMYDGSVAVWDIGRQEEARFPSSRCLKTHLRPVWQVKWTTQKSSSPAAESEWVELFVSASADGTIAKWHFSGDGLHCIGADSSVYLLGTWDGLVHRGSLNAQHFIHTYRKHTNTVNHIEWSPFCSDVFLSCSSDQTVRLWKQDLSTPVMSFTSTQTAVRAIRWFPKCSTIFAAINDRQLEIWDLKSSVKVPAIVRPAALGVKMTSLLFVGGTDCVLVGDSDGIVTVYRLENLNVGEQQVN
ncbi:dynein axonemal intermediate chain 4-like [Brachionichthys hirsutus]|uniref:dynein axonemal intermediate chain 4-like n=1 Tax=Brachionichthys hirsutus TaxID=412623 RepID=UPI003604B2A1